MRLYQVGFARSIAPLNARGAWLVCLLSTAILTASETGDRVNESRILKTADHSLAVQYKDGTTERYHLHWAGSIRVHVWSTAPAEPIVDRTSDAPCNAEVSSRIDRTILLLSHSGKMFLAASGNGTVAAPFPNEREKPLPLLAEDCNSAHFNASQNAAVDFMNKNFDKLVDDDFEKAAVDAKKDPQVAKVDKDPKTQKVQTPSPSPK
jgi:hypothetical protein